MEALGGKCSPLLHVRSDDWLWFPTSRPEASDRFTSRNASAGRIIPEFSTEDSANCRCLVVNNEATCAIVRHGGAASSILKISLGMVAMTPKGDVLFHPHVIAARVRRLQQILPRIVKPVFPCPRGMSNQPRLIPFHRAAVALGSVLISMYTRLPPLTTRTRQPASWMFFAGPRRAALTP